MGQNFHKIEAVRLEGGDPPPQRASPPPFFPFFFYYFPYVTGTNVIRKIRWKKQQLRESFLRNANLF